MPQLDRAVSNPEWSADGKRLTFLLQDDRTVTLAAVPAGDPNGNAPDAQPPAGGWCAPLSAGKDGNFAVSQPRRASSAEVYALEAGKLRQLTKHNDKLASLNCSWLRPKTSSRRARTAPRFTASSSSQPATSPARNTRRSSTSTADRTARTSTPGASTASCSRPTAMWCWRSTIAAAPAAATRSRRRSYADWGHLEVVDLLGAVDEAVKQGIADPDRLGIGGWSYGGISTNYTIATDHALQGGDQRRRQLVAAHHVRRRPLHAPVRPRNRSAVEEPRTCG